MATAKSLTTTTAAPKAPKTGGASKSKPASSSGPGSTAAKRPAKPATSSSAASKPKSTGASAKAAPARRKPRRTSGSSGAASSKRTRSSKRATGGVDQHRTSLFDVSDYTQPTVDGEIAKVPLAELRLAPNPRKHISQEGIERLASMLMSTGQLVPLIGQRIDDYVLIYDGQRRFLAALASVELAGTEGFEGCRAVKGLVVVLLDHEPTPEEIRRIQAQANAREELTRADQQEQFADCWAARVATPDGQRIAAVCNDLGIQVKKAHSLLREIGLPEAIRHRVSERPVNDELSIRMAAQLAEMHSIAPELTDAVATRISTRDLHERALTDLGGFVHRTVVESPLVYATRIDPGALLDGATQVEQARAHLSAAQVAALVPILKCDKSSKVEEALDKLARESKAKALKIVVDESLRDRAVHGRFAWSFDRGSDFANGVWIIDPLFMLSVVNEHLEQAADGEAQEESFFGGARLEDDAMKAAADAERQEAGLLRKQRQAASTSNLGLGHDLRAGILEPTADQLNALRALVCHLLADQYPEIIAYGAGWTDTDRQQPIGDQGSMEPRQVEAIVSAELRRALEDPDPLRGIMQLVTRWGAAFTMDPAGPTRGKTLGSERLSKKLERALPGGDGPQRAALWALMRPMLSPRLLDLNRDAFVVDESATGTVDLDAHRGESSLADLDLGTDADHAEAA
jgi:hypothetical protein